MGSVPVTDQRPLGCESTRPPTAMIARLLTREGVGLIVQAGLLFGAAGRFDWAMGWVAMTVTTLWVVATAGVLVGVHPDLIPERLGPKRRTRRWDLAILSAIGVLLVARCVVAGLDERFGWTTVPAGLQAVAVLLAVGGYGLLVWATWANAFFAQTARLQPERGQTVATGGPYRLVRHPGYLGAIVSELALPVMLGSWWALLPSAAGAAALIVRTALEDRMLRGELEGYAAYAGRVRWRLVPGVW